MKMVLLQISTEHLARILKLPENAVIIETVSDPLSAPTVLIKVMNAGYNAVAGGQLCRTTGILSNIELDENGNYKYFDVDWNLPQEAPMTSD